MTSKGHMHSWSCSYGKVYGRFKNNSLSSNTNVAISHPQSLSISLAKARKSVRTFKGEVRRFFFYRLKVFIGLKLREVSIYNFHRKAPKWAKISGQSVKNWPNKTPFASDLLWESTNSVIGAAVGIHLLIIGFPQQLRWRNWWIPTVGRMLKLPKSGFPQ